MGTIKNMKALFCVLFLITAAAVTAAIPNKPKDLVLISQLQSTLSVQWTIDESSDLPTEHKIKYRLTSTSDPLTVVKKRRRKRKEKRKEKIEEKRKKKGKDRKKRKGKDRREKKKKKKKKKKRKFGEKKKKKKKKK